MRKKRVKKINFYIFVSIVLIGINISVIFFMNINNHELVSTYNDLRESEIEINNELSDLQEKIDEKKLLDEELQSKVHYISNVKKVSQFPNYPTGCEVTALYILLSYWNVDTSIEKIIDVLPKGDAPYYENGILYGANPNVEFVGNPKEEYSFGVFEGPLIKVANHFKKGAVNATGKSLDEILQIVSLDKPVLVWVSYEMKEPYISISWTVKETGETIDWIKNEHALVIIGYNESEIITSDPYTGKEMKYNKELFESRYNYYGKKAIFY